MRRINRTIELVAEYYDIPPELIIGQAKHASIVRARQITAYLLRKVFGLSYAVVGKAMGGRDHTTALYSLRAIQAKRHTDTSLSDQLNHLTRVLATEFPPQQVACEHDPAMLGA